MKKISFPEIEVEGLRGRKVIYTTRVSSDFNKFQENDVVKTPWGEKYVVKQRHTYKGYENHPYLKELTEEQQDELSKYKKQSFLEMHRMASFSVPAGTVVLNTRKQQMMNKYGANYKLYMIWQAMKQRCYRETHPRYNDWGGRGIEMDEKWKTDFQSFYDWALKSGYKPDKGLSLDRVDNDKGYNPKNCKWVDAKAQANNRRKRR